LQINRSKQANTLEDSWFLIPLNAYKIRVFLFFSENMLCKVSTNNIKNDVKNLL